MTEIRSVCEDCWKLVARYLESTKSLESGRKQVELSKQIIHDSLDKHDIREIALSFNGGKDCLVMLVLFLAVLHERRETHDVFAHLDKIPSVYVHVENSFKQVDNFVDECKKRYHLDVVRLAPPLKDGFEKYLGMKPDIRAILVGIRRTDPYGGKLTYYERTDHGWPDFMRIHPVLEWHYVEIWDFLRFLEIPYCCLYDMGYTSLGGTTNTVRNPWLKQKGDQYKPAYELVDDEKERLSRQG